MTAVSLTLSNLLLLLKSSFQLAFMAIEVILTFYSDVLEDSLVVKFLLFVITAVLIAMAVTKLANNVLPEDKDYISAEDEEGNF